jgi:2-oxoglutarate ferredoxin oxidoreductase subunit delta
MKFWRTPLDCAETRISTGSVHIIADRCKGCGFCVEFCPREVLAISGLTNRKGYPLPEVKEGAICADCGLCTLLCPDFAIYVESGAQPTGGQTPAPPKGPPP